MNIKKSKKHGLLSIMLVFTLMLGGCQSTGTQKIQKVQNDESSSKITKNTADEDTLIVTYQTIDGSVTKDLDEVLEKVNQITEKKIGVKVSFEVSAAVTSGKDYPLWISEGKKIDLMLINFQDITSYINYGLIQPLDSFLEEDGTEITRLVEEGYYLTEGTIIDGKTYGVGIASSDVGTCYGIWIPKSYLNAVDFQYEKDHVYDWEELTGLFEQLKKKYPDAYPLGQITSSNFFSNAQFYGLQAVGNVSVDSDGTVYNYFAQEEYYQFLTQMHRWYEQGFIYEDAGFTDATQLDLIRSGKILSFPFLGNPGNTGDLMFKEPCVCLRTSEVTYNHRGSVGIFWTIPKTSAHPNDAMKFLNLLYEDTELSNLIQYGIEKKHYIVTDQEYGQIQLPYGVTENTVGYSNPLGIYGNQSRMLTFDSKEVIEERRQYNKAALQKREEMQIFYFNPKKVEIENAAVEKVIAEYVPILESGSVDVDRYYRQFLKELELAGIDNIMQEKKRQYDQWKRMN